MVDMAMELIDYIQVDQYWAIERYFINGQDQYKCKLSYKMRDSHINYVAHGHGVTLPIAVCRAVLVKLYNMGYLFTLQGD